MNKTLSMPTTEVPKRLAPSRETLRELYLKSGNRCAFPACKKSLFNAKGVFVGQICHIEAAEPGGERFNKNQTNDQRRQAGNLVLMCYEHHVETDDVDKFPVSAMKRTKIEHEKIYSDVVGTMLFSVKDHTTLTAALLPKNLRKLDEIFKWALSDEEISECIDDAHRLINKLAKVPTPSRELFLIIINRGEDGRFGADLDTSVPEIQQATSLGNDDLRGCFSILQRAGFTFDNDMDDMGVQMVGVAKAPSGWKF